VSRYAFDVLRRELLVAWGTGRGDVASMVVAVPAEVADAEALALVDKLNDLSRAVWRTYTHPSSAAGDDGEVNTEGWRRDQHRAAFSGVAEALRQPNLPSGGGLIVSYNPVEECAHRVGRALHRIGIESLVGAVVADVAAELQAVEAAECGDLSDRARQAVLLTRADASPVQVAAADRLLAGDPFGDEQLFTDIDSTAAAVAAAAWLAAAADVAGKACDMEPTRVAVEADNIEALPHASPTQVLELIELGATAESAVLGMIHGAMRAADGEIPDFEELLAKIAEADELAEEYGRDDPELFAKLLPRLTPLDTTRPARDLLEDLLSGIHGCYLLYREVQTSGLEDLDPDAEVTEEQYEALENRDRKAFIDAVRARKAASEQG